MWNVSNGSDTIKGDKGVHNFPQCIRPKVNVIEAVGFELAYYVVVL